MSEAEQELTRVTKSAPKSSIGFEHLGDVYQKMGKAADARASWEKALSLANDDEVTKSRLKAKLGP